MGTPDTAFTEEQYATTYPRGVETHYWYLGRNRILFRKLGRFLAASDKVLEIGCGTGIVVDYLRDHGVDCTGVEVGPAPPASDKVAPHLHLSQSAFDLDVALRSSFTTILLLDVLEHLPDPVEFLEKCAASFPNVRRVFVTLPARMEIWSNYDEYNGHFLRYSLEGLAELASKSPFRLTDSGYFFHLLYTAARAVKASGKPRRIDFVVPKNPLPHAIMARLFDLEEAIVPSGLPGSSVYGVLER